MVGRSSRVWEDEEEKRKSHMCVSLSEKWRDIVCWNTLFIIRAPWWWFSFILLSVSHISQLLKEKMQHSPSAKRARGGFLKSLRAQRTGLFFSLTWSGLNAGRGCSPLLLTSERSIFSCYSNILQSEDDQTEKGPQNYEDSCPQRANMRMKAKAPHSARSQITTTHMHFNVSYKQYRLQWLTYNQ